MTTHISVIIPFFKAGRFAKQLISSISKQSYDDFEVILVDDGKGVDFQDVIGEIDRFGLRSKFLFVSTMGAMGPANARNLGLELASGRFISFLDTDDTWDSKFLITMVEHQKKLNSPFLVSEVTYQSEKRKIVLKLPLKLFWTDLLQTCPIQPPAVLLDKKIIGSFYFPDCKHEDYALWLKVLDLGISIDCVNEALVTVNRVSGSVSSRKSAAASWHWDILKKQSKKTLGTRIILFSIYVINGFMKRSMPLYKPLLIRKRIIEFMP